MPITEKEEITLIHDTLHALQLYLHDQVTILQNKMTKDEKAGNSNPKDMETLADFQNLQQRIMRTSIFTLASLKQFQEEAAKFPQSPSSVIKRREPVPAHLADVMPNQQQQVTLGAHRKSTYPHENAFSQFFKEPSMANLIALLTKVLSFKSQASQSTSQIKTELQKSKQEAGIFPTPENESKTPPTPMR